MSDQLIMVDAPAAAGDGRDDFDFFLGVWDSRQRRLKDWKTGGDEWEEYPSVSVARKILGGLGHMDEVTINRANGALNGLTVRLFDPKTRLWSIYWASDSGVGMTAPQIGRFENGRGEFYDHEVYEGVALFCRFLWTSDGPDACHWEQAFSTDGGRTWKANWIADFTRRDGGRA